MGNYLKEDTNLWQMRVHFLFIAVAIILWGYALHRKDD